MSSKWSLSFRFFGQILCLKFHERLVLRCEVLGSLSTLKMEGYQLSVFRIYLLILSTPGAVSPIRNMRISTAVMTRNLANMDHLVLQLRLQVLRWNI